MPVVAKRYKVKFEETKLQFSEDYPSALSDVLTLAEFDSVVRKINEEMSAGIRARQKKVKKWSAACIGLCLIVAGVCLTPVVLVQTRRQRKETKAFWERLRNYLGEINRKTFLKRNLEWKLVEDKRKVNRRDVANPLLAYRIEVVHRVQKGKTTGSRFGADSTVGSRSGVGGSTISRGAASGSLASRSQRKSLGAFSVSSYNTEPTGLTTTASISPPSDTGEDGRDVFSEGALGTTQQDNDIDDIIIMEEDEEEYGEGGLEDESGNLASSSSQGGAGSYSRGSLIIDPMAAPIAASSLALASTRERTDEGRAAAAASLPKPEAFNDKMMPATTPVPKSSEDEERASAMPLPESSDNENDVTTYRPRGREKRLSKVRFSGLFKDGEDED